MGKDDQKLDEMMALEVSKKKTLRTSSKRSFTRTKNNLMKSIEDDEGLDLVQD